MHPTINIIMIVMLIYLQLQQQGRVGTRLMHRIQIDNVVLALA